MSTSKKETPAPQKYKVLPGAIDVGKQYEINNISLLVLKCCFKELEEFWLASNVRGLGALDDIVMFTKRKESDQGVTYLMQLKHQVALKPILTKMFLDNRSDFSFVKYSISYSEIHKNIEIGTQNKMLAHFKQNDKMVIIILTNKPVEDKEEYTDKSVKDRQATHRLDTNDNRLPEISRLLESLLEIDLEDKSATHTLRKMKSLLQTLLEKPTIDKPLSSTVPKFLIKIQEPSPILNDIGYDGDIFKIDYEVLAAEPNINVEFLKKLYLFTNQLPNSSMEDKIKSTLIKNLGKKLQLSDEDASNIVLKFIKFVEQWAKGELGGHYRLTKDSILKKLVELLLVRYKFRVQAEENEERMEEEDIEENEENNIWYEITQDKDVTVIDDADDVVHRYVRNVTNKIICNSNIGNRRNLPTSERYERLWKTGKIPLILEVSDERGVLYIQQVLNKFPKVFRIIILNKTKIHFEGFGDLKLFDNLCDLNTKHQQLILWKPIKLQGRGGSCIQKLNINLKLFKVKDILHILCGKFNVGGKFDDVPQFFVEMSSTTHIFDIKLLQHSEDIFVVWCGSLLDDFELVLKNQLRIDAKKIIHWERLINQADFKGQIIIFKAVENLKEIEKFCLSSRKPIHFFAWHGGYDVNLIKSVNIENLKKRKRNSITSSLAKKLLQNFCEKKTTLIISAIPGMGKSVLMNYFAQKMPIHLWVLHIPLATYRDHYKNWEGQNIFSQQLKFEQFLLDIVKAQKKPNTKIFDEAFAQFINFKNVVFLLDGLDEVPVNLQNGAMQLIKFINQSGYYTCVTTSPLLQEQLESTLNTFAIKLNMFTKNEQTSFLTDYFENTRTAKPSNEKVEEFVCKLLKATKSNLNDFDQKFTGVPLQTKLLAEVFEKNLLKYLDDGIFRNERFDLIYLYEHFIKKKIEIAFAKVENVSEHMIDQYKQCRSFYALRHLFDEQDLEELKINERINVINDMLPLALQLIQKDGITIIDGDWNVTFVHQTYAEYLAANWLTENIKEHKEIVRKLYLKCFNWNFVVVRNMFDRILAKDYPLHTTVINCQVDTVETLILDENAFDATDRGGRTIVHLLSAWNSPLEWYTTVHDLIMDNLQSNTYTMLKNKLMHVEDEILHYSVLDYAILSRSFKAARFLICELKNPSSNIDITKTESDDIIRHMKWRRDMPLYIIILKCFIRTSFNEHEVKNIHKRIRNGDLHKVRSRIFDFDDPDSEGRTLLHAATKGGHKGTVRFLLKKKANVNKTDNNGRSALHWASYLGHMEIIYLLLSHGAKPDVTDCYNLTTYHYAILSSLENQVEVVSLLLSRNRTIATQNLNAFDKINYLNYRDKVHPVYLLDVETQQAVLNLILCHNVDANIKGFMGTTSLMFAAENNDVDSVKLLLANNADIHAVDDSNLTALHYAVIMGHGKVVTVLLTNNADVNARDSGNITPLHWAAYWCNQEAVTILLKYSADVNAKDPYNKTPLHYAAACNYQDVVTILLAHNADVNAKYPYNKTPPHWTAMHGNEDVVTILLKYSADVNGKYSYNKSPLHLAVEKGSQNIVTILLGNGANMHTKSVDNETPLDIAVRKGNQDIVTILTNANSKYK